MSRLKGKTYRQIDIEIFDDSWIASLRYYEKFVFVHLISNRRTGKGLGIYEINERAIAYETDLPVEQVVAALDKIEADGKIVRDKGWIWVVNLFAYNCNNPGSPQIQESIKGQLENVGSAKLRRLWQERYGTDVISIPARYEDDANGDEDTVSIRYGYDMDTVSDHKHKHKQKQKQEQKHTISPGDETGGSSDEIYYSTPSELSADAPPTEPPKPEISWPNLNEFAEPVKTPAPPPEKKPTKRQKTTTPREPPPPAIATFREKTERYPPKAVWSIITDAVGEDETNLKRWGETIVGWLGMGWNPTNVNGMLEFYRKNEIPKGGGGNGHGTHKQNYGSSVSWAKRDGWTEAEIRQMVAEREREESNRGLS